MADTQLLEFEVRSSIRSYAVRFVNGFGDAVTAALRPDDVFVIDNMLRPLHNERLQALIGDRAVIGLDATENQKSYEAAGPVLVQLVESGVRKKQRLVAVGGGIIQDVVGFVASILYRGIEWLFVPTTLLAQGDSCIGAKTSINLGRYKNQLGGFYPPTLVLIDVEFLRTLPDREMMSGLGEMAHYFLLDSDGSFEYFAAALPHVRNDSVELRRMISRSLSIKRRFIEADEFDRGERQLLNYGHSFGHALETVTSYSIPHGIAVCYGMELANFVSEQLGYLSPPEARRMNQVLAVLREGWILPPVNLTEYEEALKRDKKNRGDELGLILTRGVGGMFKYFQPLNARFSRLLAQFFAGAA